MNTFVPAGLHTILALGRIAQRLRRVDIVFCLALRYFPLEHLLPPLNSASVRARLSPLTGEEQLGPFAYITTRLQVLPTSCRVSPFASRITSLPTPTGANAGFVSLIHTENNIEIVLLSTLHTLFVFRVASCVMRWDSARLPQRWPST